MHNAALTPKSSFSGPTCWILSLFVHFTIATDLLLVSPGKGGGSAKQVAETTAMFRQPGWMSVSDSRQLHSDSFQGKGSGWSYRVTSMGCEVNLKVV